MSHRRASLLLALLLTGCSQVALQDASAPELPCEGPSISIAQVEGGKTADAPLSWEATCKGERYLCSRIHQRVICDLIPAGVQLQRED